METDEGSKSAESADSFDYAMVDRRVTNDPRLKHVDVRIYDVMAGCRMGSRVKMGMRLIARGACTSLKNVGPALKRLEKCGYLEIKSGGPRSRAEYRLTYWRFNTAEAKAAEPVEEAPQSRSTKECPRCHKQRRQILKAGWCRSCNREIGIRRIVREEIGQTPAEMIA